MSATHEPALSTSAMHPPLASAHAPSMAETLPSINFGFDTLRERMAKFTSRFDAFIEQGRKRVLEERNQFRVSAVELSEDRRMRRKDIEILAVKTQAHQQMLEREAAEAREMDGAIAKLEAQREAKAREREALGRQIAEAQRLVEEKIALQRAHAAKVSSQAVHDIPELDFWTSNLGLRIEGAGMTDRLKFVFTHVDERDWEREAWFELCTERRDYEIGGCSPKLERERVDRVLDRLNEKRELGAMLKGMRELFVEAMKA